MGIARYHTIAQLPAGAQLKALHQAVREDLRLTQVYLDLCNGRASGKSVSLLNGAKQSMPSIDSIKAYYAQKYATPSDNPILTDVSARVESFFHSNMPEIDLGWTNMFQFVDMRQTNQDTFDIIDASAGISFVQRSAGEITKINRQVNEGKLSVPSVTYSAGIGILDDWLRFAKLWNVEQAVAEFNAKYWDKQAEIHYGLFTGQGAGIDTAFDTDDTVTFNAAAAKILRDVRGKGFAVGQGVSFIILTSPEKLGRILKMLESTQGSARVAFQQNAEPIAYTVSAVVSSTYVPANDTGYYLILPGRKLQRGTWDDLNVESKRDINVGAEDWVGVCRFNAAIGATEQVRRVKFA